MAYSLDGGFNLQYSTLQGQRSVSGKIYPFNPSSVNQILSLDVSSVFTQLFPRRERLAETQTPLNVVD
jgi:hypothetical protein